MLVFLHLVLQPAALVLVGKVLDDPIYHIIGAKEQTVFYHSSCRSETCTINIPFICLSFHLLITPVHLFPLILTSLWITAHPNFAAKSWASRSGFGWRALEVRASSRGRRLRWTTGGPQWLKPVPRAPAPPRSRRVGASMTAHASDPHSALRASLAPQLTVSDSVLPFIAQTLSDFIQIHLEH